MTDRGPRQNTSGEGLEQRTDYDRGTLRRQDLSADPVAQLRRWLDDAARAGVAEPNAMVLATADSDGAPSVRTVLLRGLAADGLRFFTHHPSQKGRELAANPQASVCFLWAALQRQVRVSGPVYRLDDEAADAYFASRPRASQIGAWASDQSQIIDRRDDLEARVLEMEARFAGREVPRPPGWGGYRLEPTAFEFWHGRRSRLHDRLRYRRPDGEARAEAWVIDRLAP